MSKHPFAEVQDILRDATQGYHPKDNTIYIKLSPSSDPFAKVNDPAMQVIVFRTLTKIRGKKLYLRRAYARVNDIADYRFVGIILVMEIKKSSFLLSGWAFDLDPDGCMICGTTFSTINRRHHCRVCGDLICADCSSGRVTLVEFTDYGKVRVCDSCFIGQVIRNFRFLFKRVCRKRFRLNRRTSRQLPPR
jgi:hypothetical protein